MRTLPMFSLFILVGCFCCTQGTDVVLTGAAGCGSADINGKKRARVMKNDIARYAVYRVYIVPYIWLTPSHKFISEKNGSFILLLICETPEYIEYIARAVGVCRCTHILQISWEWPRFLYTYVLFGVLTTGNVLTITFLGEE